MADNTSDKKDFKDLTNDEDRRRYVSQEFLDGALSDPTHIDFFMEQVAKGEIPVGKEKTEDLKSLILDGVPGYDSLAQRKEKIAARIMSGAIHRSTPTSYMTPTGQAVSSDITLQDLGVKEYLADIEKLKKRDDFDNLILSAHKQALDQQYNGAQPDYEIRSKIEKSKANLKWYQFKRKRQAEKALQAVDPLYFDTKQVNGSALGKMTGYYKLRGWWRDYKRGRFNDELKELQSTLDAKSEYDGTRWLSKKAFKKLKLGAKLLFSPSIEMQTENLLSVANKEQLKQLKSMMADRFGEMDKTNALSTLHKRSIDAQKKVLEQIIVSTTARDKALDNELKSRVSALEASYPEQNKINARTTKFKQSIVEKAAQLEKDLQDVIAKDPSFKLLQNISSQEKVLTEKAITPDKLMETLFKEMDIPQEQKDALRKLMQSNEKKNEEQQVGQKEENVDTSVDKKEQKKQEEKSSDELRQGQEQEPSSAQPLEEEEEKKKNRPVIERDSHTENKDDDRQGWNHLDNTNVFSVYPKELDAQLIDELSRQIKESSKDGSFTLNVKDFSDQELESFKKSAQEHGLKIFDKEGNEFFTPQKENQAENQGVTVERNQSETSQQNSQSDDAKEKTTQEPAKETAPREEAHSKSSEQTSEGGDRSQEDHTKNLSNALNDAMKTAETPEKQMEVVNFFSEVQNGAYNDKTVKEFHELMSAMGIDPKSEAGLFLGEMAAAKALDAELKADEELSTDKKLMASLGKDKRKAGLRDRTDKNKLDRLTTVDSLFKKYDGKADELVNDESFKKLPERLKNSVKTVVSETDPKKKDKQRTAVLASLIYGKNNTSSRRPVHKTELSKGAVAQVAGSKGKE